VHANQLSSWKKLLLAGAAGLFDDCRTHKETSADQDELYTQTGRPKLEVDFPKNCVAF